MQKKQRNLASLDSALEKVMHAAEKGGHILVAIEGNSGAGKSSFARLLNKKLGCAVVHVDDFFLQQQQRTGARLLEIGGNVDYERLLQVVAQARTGDSFEYTPYNCQTSGFSASVFVPSTSITVVEGVYSMHPFIKSVYDISFFMSVEEAEQRERILKRSGEELSQRFYNEWIPMENLYFKTYAVEKKCSFVLDTNTVTS